MNTSNFEFNTQSRNGSIDVETASALLRMHDDISRLRTSDNTIGTEMNKIHLVCDAPPAGPKCHIEVLPPNPVTVEKSLVDLQANNSMLQIELAMFSNAVNKGGIKAEKDFLDLSKQFQLMQDEIKQLDKLLRVDGKPISRYDKSAITDETETIDSLGRLMERTRKKLEHDWGSE